MNKKKLASELIKVAKDLVAGGTIGINEVRRDLKKLGFKVRLKSLSWGPHAEFYDSEGNGFPSMFSKEALERWKPLIDYKKGLNRRYDSVVDKYDDFVYGFDFKKNKVSKDLVGGSSLDDIVKEITKLNKNNFHWEVESVNKGGFDLQGVSRGSYDFVLSVYAELKGDKLEVELESYDPETQDENPVGKKRFDLDKGGRPIADWIKKAKLASSGRTANRLKWKKMIEMPNNSAYVGVESPKRLSGGRKSGSVYVFSATPFSAKSILRDAEKAYPRNEVVMKVRKKVQHDEGYDANIYEIYVIMGDDKEASQRTAASVSPRDVLKGYLTTALWSETDDDGDNLDSNYNIRDIAGASLRGARSDINKFIKQAGDLLDLDGNKGSQIGHDLWLNRNGHGAGFWDGDYPEAGKELDKIASRMGGKYIYVGDDGKVYID